MLKQRRENVYFQTKKKQKKKKSLQIAFTEFKLLTATS